MTSNRLLVIFFIALLVISTFYIQASSQRLPENVGTHFGGGGIADAFMSRDGYCRYMLLFGLGFPVLLVLAIVALPRFGQNFSIGVGKNKRLIGLQRQKALSILTKYGLWLGCFLNVFITLVHGFILQANLLNPPKLDSELFLLVLGVFLLWIFFWVFLLIKRLRKLADA